MILSKSGKIGSGKDTVGHIMQILIDMPHFSNKAVIEYLDKKDINYSYKNKKFADKLKDIVCLLIGCTKEQLEDRDFKETSLGEEWTRYSVANGFWSHSDNNPSHKRMDSKQCSKAEYENEVKVNWQTAYKTVYTPRLLLQHIGTELFRNQIIDGIWVNALMSEYKPKEELVGTTPENIQWGEVYPNWIITDTRFPNEHQAVKDKGGINIRVNRPYTTVVGGNGIPATFSQNQFHPSETSLDSATFDFVISNDKDIEHLINEVMKILEAVLYKPLWDMNTRELGLTPLKEKDDKGND